MSKPFENIALSLSGGGYRAAAFHLGAMSYLDQLEYQDISMLKRVKVLSTISGGTFTGMVYAMTVAKGQDFKTCFLRLYVLMKEDQLIVKALEKVNHVKKWHAPEKSKNLINAMSEVYQADYCEHEHLSLMLSPNTSHLDEFSFNATDLFDAIPFRFQNGGLIGNGNLHISPEAAAEIRLGDVMAASSCFPGGFEPLVFPNDFLKAKGSPLDQYWQGQPGYPPEIGIMDGGIVDNQGIESILLYNKRQKENQKPEVGTFIISDVASRNAAEFEVPAVSNMGLLGKVTPRGLTIFLWIVFILALIGIGFTWDDSKVWPLVLSFVAVFAGLGLSLLYWVQAKIGQFVANTIGQKTETSPILKNLNILRRTPIAILFHLVSVRIFSLGDIVESVFMNRIRSLQISALFNDPFWSPRILGNNIYSLFTDYDSGKAVESPSDQMLATTRLAAKMGTTLWFSDANKEKGMLDVLILGGQINMCYKLLKYLSLKLKNDPIYAEFDPETKASLQTLEDRVRADYQKFKNDERWLLNVLLGDRA